MTTMITTPPTEADIRAAIDAHVTRYGVRLDSVDAMWHPFDALVSRGVSPWRDLRPSEDGRLRDLIDAAEARAVARCRAILLEEAVAAALAFAAEYPDARRREPVR